jgi:hypothetical protein
MKIQVPQNMVFPFVYLCFIHVTKNCSFSIFVDATNVHPLRMNDSVCTPPEKPRPMPVNTDWLQVDIFHSL